jgi:hypothetical protein
MMEGLFAYKVQRSHSGRQGHDEFVGFWSGFSFPKIWVLGAIALCVKTPLLYPHQGYVAKTGHAER